MKFLGVYSLMVKIFQNKPVVVAILLLTIACFWALFPADELETGKVSKESASATAKPAVRENSPIITERKKAEPVTKQAATEFSPEMTSIVQGIHAGRSIHLRVDDFEAEYVFRSIDITEDRFQVSTGPETTYPAAYEVFEGREVLKNGSVNSEAKLAVVNDTLSIAFTNEKGDFLIEKDDSGEMVAIQLSSTDPDSDLGAWVCENLNGIHGVADASNNAEKPVTNDIAIVLGAEADESTPEVEEARTSEPFYRLGKEYDASLRDISVLMISGSTQTGTSANLSSRAASYFTYSAFVADIYERQLGLRFRLQELVLIASDSNQPDVEFDAEGGGSDLGTVSDWCATYRPQATYQWGHATAWTLVNGDSGGTIGRAYTRSYGSSRFGISINERAFTWGVLIHEIGHNVGANHSIGGAMNSSVSRPPQEDFYRENADNGGFTAAKQIYDYMSVSTRNFVTGPADLRNPDEMPFAVDDFITTPTNTPVTFNPLGNDSESTPLFGATNNLRLVEVGQIFPKAAGTLTLSENEITFSPTGGYTGRVWFTYTLGGSVGNNERGWLHSADVVVTVGGNNSDPDQNPSISTTNDIVKTDFSGDVRLNPLLNDEGVGRLWAGGVDAINSITPQGVAQSYSEGAFSLVSAAVVTGNGSVSLETANVTRDGVASTGNTGYLVYTPGGNEPSIVEIQYTVEDEDGNQATGMISLVGTETVSVSASLSTLAEPEGRVVTVSISRSGSTAAAEWVDFSITGVVELTGANSDVAISGFDSFDASSGAGRVTIPAGQSSVEFKVSAMEDFSQEDDETFNIVITRLETLLVDSNSGAASILISDTGGVIFSEDFEEFPQNTTLANGWTNETTSSGVWTADRNGTASTNTGPNVDHTLGTGTGSYLYREASSNTNQQADLTSPTINLVGTRQPRLEFYYHMFGAAMGELHVDVFSNGVWNLDVMPPLDGQQQTSSGADWLLAGIDISNFKTADFQVRFRGITGNSFTSDMAIDDVTIVELQDPSVEAPVIEGPPQSIAALTGDSAYFSVVARAFPAPTYQWRRNGQTISGATRSSYYIEAVSLSDVGEYTCVVTSGTPVTSFPAILSIGVEDLDGDGLEDAWEIAFFGDTDELGTGDFDNDGVVNLLERAFGTAPNDNADKSLPTAAIIDDAGNEHLSLSYRRLEGGVGSTGVNYTVGGIRYTVQYDADLVAPWSSGGIVQIGSAVSNGDGTETVTVRVPTSLDDGDTVFMRVLISPAL